MVDQFHDKFNRDPDNGVIGTNYTVPCGGVLIVDNESVVPIDAAEVESGTSPLFDAGTTALKTQVLYTASSMDSPDQLIRIIWAHDPLDDTQLDDITSDPSIGILARMSKDPLLYDLGTAEDPACYDQGYSARVTMPRDGSPPVLKIVKLMPNMRIPSLRRPTSTEVDGMIVLASVVLQDVDLNLDPTYDADVDTELPYRGFWQDMRLRIRRSDNEVILDVYLNDRNLNQPILSYTDKADPLWGDIGSPGFEFIGATLGEQPAGVSPFSLAGLSTLRVGQFSAQTVKDLRRPVRVQPSNLLTYREVTNRVITLVEKNGDSRYNSTTSGTKFQTYLDFVWEAETSIIKAQGYWSWLFREQTIYLQDGVADYEVPADCGEVVMIRPSWNQPPLTALDYEHFHQRFGPAVNTSGRPIAFTMVGMGPDDRAKFRLFPVPQLPAAGSATTSQNGDETVTIQYNARALRVLQEDADVLVPLVPQEHIDVLIYGAAAHALLLNVDGEDSGRFSAAYVAKLNLMRRSDNRRPQRVKARHAADVLNPVQQTRLPLTRTGQLENLL